MDDAPPAIRSAQPPSHSVLTAALDELLRLSGGGGTTLGAMMDLLADRGVALLMVICATPFLLPLSIPGLSTPFGAVLAFCGVFMLIGRPVRLPRRLGARILPHRALERTVGLLRRIFGRLERLLHPRWLTMVEGPLARRVHGLYVLAMAVVLGIPFPPVLVGSNAIAAWPIFLLGLGLLERDGRCVTVAYAWLIVFAAYWLLLWAAVVELWRAMSSA